MVLGGLVVLVAASLSFLLLHLAPGDPISALADASRIPPELRAQWRAAQGYDRPLLVQYVDWLGHVLRLDFGYAVSQQRPVRDVLLDRLPNTLLLMSLALAASLVGGMLIGAWQGAHSRSRGDRLVSAVTLLLYSIPEFWLALGLLYLFAYRFPFFPATGVVDVAQYDQMGPGARLADRLHHLVLPWLALTLVGTAVFARVQRAAMREVMREPFVRTARAIGLRESRVRWQAWRTALRSVTTMAGLYFPALLTGAVFVERVFAWPGMGGTLVQAIGARDYALVSACVVVGSAMTALGSLLADAATLWLDPREGTT